MKIVVLTALLSGVALATFPSCTPKAGEAAAKTSATAPAAPAKSYADAWDITVSDTPLGTVTGVLTLTETDGALGGSLRTGGQTYAMKRVVRTDDGVTATFFFPDAGADVDITLAGAQDADVLSGRTMGDFLTVAKRQ